MHTFQGSNSVHRVNANDPADLRQWADKLEVSEARLLAAIDLAGPDLDAIRRALEDMHRAFSNEEV